MKKCCIFTFVRNERMYLDIWLKYYSKYFNGDDIYILNHGSNDGSIEECRRYYKFNLIDIPYECFDEILRIKIANEKQAELLRTYQYTMYADADEIIVPDLKIYRDLADYIDKFDKSYVTCTGYNIIQMRPEESAIDLKRSILEQRRYWYRDHAEDKTLLANMPLNWIVGFHRSLSAEPLPDGKLLLLHLAKVDFKSRESKVKEISSSKWSVHAMTMSAQLRFDDSEAYEKWFYLQKRMRWYHPIKWLAVRIYRLMDASYSRNSWSQWWEENFYYMVRKIPSRLKNSKIV